MANERQVWIVGDVEAGARAGDQRYHPGHCYVLDQVGNRGRTRKVALAELPMSFQPCQICAPGGRLSSSTTASADTPAHASVGIQPGHEVVVEDMLTRETSTHRISAIGKQRTEGQVSPGSPFASALIGKQSGDVVEFSPPSGNVRKLRVVRFE